jgi:hypothetical protein
MVKCLWLKEDIMGNENSSILDKLGALGQAYLVIKLLPLIIAGCFVISPLLNIGMMIAHLGFDETEARYHQEAIRAVDRNDYDTLRSLDEKYDGYKKLHPEKELGVVANILIAICTLGSLYGFWRFIQFIGKHSAFLIGYIAICVFNLIVLYSHGFPGESTNHLILYRVDGWTYAAVISYLAYTIIYIVSWFKLEFNHQ